MARLFYASVLGGALLSVLVAGVFPLPQSQRYRSSISVVPDGGREETFVIDWQQDRIQPVRADGSGPIRIIGGVSVLAGSAGSATGTATAEVFRLHDVAGNVIGLASRTTSPRDGADISHGTGSEWMLLLPSRGTLFLSQVNAQDLSPRREGPDGTLVPAMEADGFWAGTTRLRMSAGPADGGAGRVTGGTEEFAGLTGTYDETWEREPVAANGVGRGRITLTTRVQAAP